MSSKESLPYPAPRTEEQDHPHACIDGWVFLGRIVESQEDLDGEVIEYDRVPCRRCASEDIGR